jgi:hypothetical protein
MTILDFITGIDRDTILAILLWGGGSLLLLLILNWITD